MSERRILNVKTGLEVVEELCRKAFSEDVGILSGGMDMKDANDGPSNQTTNKMNVNFQWVSCVSVEPGSMTCTQN